MLIRALFFLLISTQAQAQLFQSAISSGTGDTGRATIEASDSLYMNPAAIVHLRGRHLYGGFKKNEYAVSLSDNTSESLLPGGLAYWQKTENLASGEKFTTTDLGLALGEFVVPNWAFGLMGHTMTYKLDDRAYTHINADMGLLWTPRPHIGIGLVGYQILGEKKDLPESLRQRTRVGLGFNYIFKDFVRYRADILSPSLSGSGDPDAGFGFESYLTKWTVLRLGAKYSGNEKKTFYSAGFGFVGPRFHINYAYHDRHSIDLVIPF